MSRIGKSIYGRVKQIQSFEPTVCPIIVNGENGADGNHKLTFLHLCSTAHDSGEDHQLTEQEDLTDLQLSQVDRCRCTHQTQQICRQQTESSVWQPTRLTSRRLRSLCTERHPLGCGFTRRGSARRRLLRRRRTTRRRSFNSNQRTMKCS